MTRAIIRRVGEALTRRIPSPLLERVLMALVAAHARALPAREGLRFVLRLDSALYPLEGQLAIAYENGLHPRHRLTNYHDFFVGQVQPGERVLDIGCGIGAVAYAVATRAGASVVGIDLEPANIRQAQQRHAHPRVQYLVGNALELLPRQPFDVVILSNVLEHLPDRPRFLRAVQDATDTRRMLIRVPVFERDWRVPVRRELGLEWRLDRTHETEYTQEQFATEMAEAGLTIRHQQMRWGEIWAEVWPNSSHV
jgi:SAM-dependent methyltransferase